MLLSPSLRVPAWTTSHLLRTTPPGNDEIVGTLMLAVAWLRGCDRIDPPPAWVGDRIGEAIHRMPAQRSTAFATHPADAWLVFASFADYIGAFDIAWAMLGEIERLLSHAAAAAPLPGEPEHAAVNLLAITLARRGRISRQRGDVEDAVEWYKSGLRRLRNTPPADGWAQCMAGLIACAQARGNFPEVIRRCHAILRKEPPLPEPEQCSAHHALALCHRRSGKLDLALRHAWAAFDLVREQPDDRRLQCLIGVAEITLQLGHAVAARNGFRVMLAQPLPERIRIPAHVGLLAAETLLWQRTPEADSAVVRTHIETLLAETDTCLQPYERIKALLAALDAAITIGWHDRARSLDVRAGAELGSAAERGTMFNEYTFQHDALRRRLAELERAADPPMPRAPRHDVAGTRVPARTRHAVRRLAELRAFVEHDAR